MALTLERLRQMDIPLNVSNKPNNLSAFARKVAPYNDSVNLYEALELFSTGGVSSSTNITVIQNDTNVAIQSSTGSGAVITTANSNDAGILLPADWIKIQSALQEVFIGGGLIGDGSSGNPLEWEGAYVAGPITGSGTNLFPLNILNNSITTNHIQNGTILFSDWASNGATAGQVPRWNGSSWVPASVGMPSGTLGKQLIHNGSSWVTFSEITEYRTNINNNVITLGTTPLNYGKFQAYRNGMLLTYGDDYTRSDAIFTLAVVPVTTDKFIFIYYI